ncbi:hypothetical protein FACS1894190_10150 [Spirochaetia bacterium]|nr:hypothetical protein FACS1894190_10150 [Spirochaetia bacterium]
MSKTGFINSANKIIFMPVPQSVKKKLNDHCDFCIDSNIPIPIEIPSESSQVPENLTAEMIISAILQTLSNDPKMRNADYYRNFVLSLRPNILQELSAAIITKIKNNEYDIAQDIINLLRGLYNNSEKVLLMQAVLFEEEANFYEKNGRDAKKLNEKARDAYNGAIAVCETDVDILLNAGFFFAKIQNYKEAKSLLTKFVSLSDDNFRKDKACAEIKLIEENCLDDEHFCKAYKLINDNKELEGMEEIRIFISKYPDVWNAWFMLGWALRRIKRWSDAEAAFRKAIEFGASNVDTLNELAICLIETGNLKQAKFELEKALSEEPENIKIISNLAIVALKSGDKEGAASFFRIVQELDPDDEIANQFTN